MSDDEQVFESTVSGASATYPVQCSSLRKGGYVCIKGKPCKIVDMSTSKTGKHGHAKVHMTALDIFENKKLEENCPSTHNMDVPRVERIEYQIILLDDDGFFHLLTDDGEEKNDIKFNPSRCNPNSMEDIRKIIDECEESGHTPTACVLRALGEETVKEVKKVVFK